MEKALQDRVGEAGVTEIGEARDGRARQGRSWVRRGGIRGHSMSTCVQKGVHVVRKVSTLGSVAGYMIKVFFLKTMSGVGAKQHFSTRTLRLTPHTLPPYPTDWLP